ncbi:MAG: hypothetical protein ACE3JK_15640 [Sporolactobacillus sp.]
MSTFAFYQESQNGRPIAFNLSEPNTRIITDSLQQAVDSFVLKQKLMINEIDRLLDGNARLYCSDKGWFKKNNEHVFFVRKES